MTTDTDNQDAQHDGEFEDPNPPSDAWINEIRDALPLYDDAHKDIRWIAL